MQLRGVLWDFDGTVADTLPLAIAALHQVFGHYTDRRLSDAEIVALFGPSEEGAIRALVPDRWREAEEAYLAEYERRHDELARAFPGIEDALALVRARGARQGLVTGKGARSAAISLRRLGLAPYFEQVETGSPAGPIKPEGMRRTLATWDLPPGTVAYVGDAPYDWAAAAEVGLLPLGAAWDETAQLYPPGEARPLARFDSVAGLTAWLAERLGDAASSAR